MVCFLSIASILQVLANFYGKKAMVEFGGKTYTSPPLAEWTIFKRALADSSLQ